MTETMTRWWWIRHAPVLESKGRIYGQIDLEADCSQHILFKALAKELPPDALWVASHLRRTHQTATALAKAANWDLPPLLIEEGLAEQNFGDWQGLTYDAVEKQDPFFYARFWREPAIFRPPRGENFLDLFARVKETIERFNRDHAGRDIVAIAHGGSIRAALALSLDIEPARCLVFDIKPCSLTRIDHIGGIEKESPWQIGAVNHVPVDL